MFIIVTERDEFVESPICLTEADSEWLAAFGVDPSWSASLARVSELNEVIKVGSARLVKNGDDFRKEDVVIAREKFMNFVGVDEAVLAEFRTRHPSLIPLDTFIGTQRILTEYGVDAAELIHSFHFAIALAPESVKAKLDNLTELGINVVEVIHYSPSIISYSPESIRNKIDSLAALGIDAIGAFNAYSQIINQPLASIKAKMDNLTELGLDAVKVINNMPRLVKISMASINARMDNFTALGIDASKLINNKPLSLGLTQENVSAKIDTFTKLGLNAAKLINKFPPSITLASESVKAKVDNLTELGLDAIVVVNNNPSSLGFAQETIRGKVALLEHATSLLQWDYSAKDLIEAYPAILGYSNKKMKILVRIAAEHTTKSSRNVLPKQVKAALIIPLEQYILALEKLDDSQHIDFSKLKASAVHLVAPAPERKEQAKALAVTGKLGKIGMMYLDYSK